VLLDQHRTCQTQQGGRDWENTHHIGAVFDLSVDAFQRIGSLNLTPMPLRENGERQPVMSGVVEHGRNPGVRAA
jgi:hypothetical protein